MNELRKYDTFINICGGDGLHTKHLTECTEQKFRGKSFFSTLSFENIRKKNALQFAHFYDAHKLYCHFVEIHLAHLVKI